MFGKEAKMALAISQAENGTRECNRVGVSGDLGVFQINPRAHYNKATPEQLKNCLTNIKVAKAIYDTSGWYPWVAYTNKSYKRFLTN